MIILNTFLTYSFFKSVNFSLQNWIVCHW